MIYKQCVLTIENNTATLDEDIYLYRLDKNVELYFTIVNNKYKFDKSDLNNIISLTKASYFQMRLYKDAEVKYTFAIQPTDNGQAILTITNDLIDEPIEVGDYDFQISLLDADKSSMVSMPIAKQQIHVCEPLVADASETGTAVLGLSQLDTTGEIVDAFDEKGNYIRKVHVNGEIISAELFNKWETALDTNTKNIAQVSSQYKDIAKQKGLTTEQIKSLNNMFKVCAYISDDVTTQYNAFKTAFGITTTNYTITNTLTNCTNNNSNTSIEDGSNYKATLIATTGYVLDTVTVTMGGTDITSATYSNGIITINGVTGNIIITANAIAKTLTSISATYTGGNVNVGTELTSLTGITVTATYSDNTTSIVNGYTLSGTIAEGSNTITVTYQGKTTTFTVTGVAINTDVSNETKWTNEVAYTYSPITGKYVDNKTGVLIDYASYSATPYLYCKGASKIKIEVVYETTALATSNNHVYNAFYDENKTFISSFRILDSDYSVGTYKEINIPSNATYFVLSHKSEVLKNSGNNNMPVINVVPYR